MIFEEKTTIRKEKTTTRRWRERRVGTTTRRGERIQSESLRERKKSIEEENSVTWKDGGSFFDEAYFFNYKF